MSKIIYSIVIAIGSLSCFNAKGQVVDSGQYSKNSKGVKIETPVVDFKISGGIYLYDYLPLVTGGNNDFSVYAYILKTDAETKDKKFGLHVETRFRDTKLRSFYTSNVWFQEAYGFAHTNWGDFHVGKFYQKVGFLWDGSFFGNIQYFNGLKLNPDFGAEFVGNKQAGPNVNFEYSVQYISNNDGVDGAEPGRDVESDTIATFRNGFTARIAPTFKLSNKVKLSVGLSGLTGSIQRITGQSFQMSRGAGEVNLAVGNAGLLAEVQYLNGEPDDAMHPLSRPGYDNAIYYFGSIRYLFFKKLLARVSYSQVNYQGANSVEQEILPALVYNFRDNVAVIAEYDYWGLAPNGMPENLIDKSLNIVFYYGF